MPNCRLCLRLALLSLVLLQLCWLGEPLIYHAQPLLAQSPQGYVDLVRFIESDELQIAAPVGLLFVEAHKSFLVLAPSATDQAAPTTITAITAHADSLSSLNLPFGVDLLTAAADPNHQSLFFWAPSSQELLRFASENYGLPAATPTARIRLPNGSGTIQGMAVAPDSQSLYLLAADSLVIQQVALSPDSADARVVATIDLRQHGLRQARGLALHPQRQHLFTLDPTTQLLYELATDGTLVARYDLALFAIDQAQGFVFAPSGDPTDEPERLSLYLVDQLHSTPPVAVASANHLPTQAYLPFAMGGTGVAQSHNSAGRIAEFTFDPPAEPAQAASLTEVGVVVRTVRTSLYSPPSPDPSDIAYIPATPYLLTSSRLLIADGEVDEMRIYAGANLFETTFAGVLQRTYTTVPDLTREPVGLSFNPNNGHLFISDDDGIRPLIEVNPGPDKLYRTSDDSSTRFSARDEYGVTDPEGVEYARIAGVDWLFFADGEGNEVHSVRPGPNGKFDGVDDQVTHFDSAALGVADPEGIAYHPTRGTLYLVGKPATRVAEITLAGALVRYIDIAAANAKKPAGLTFAPGSQNANQWTLYIVDRNVDNDSDPNENDGLLYEVALPSTDNQPPVVNAGANQTITWPAAASLNGSVSDDGLPAPATLVTTWSYVSGPGTVTFANAQARQTSATFSTNGVYRLRLTANDGQLSASDDLVVTVNAPLTGNNLIYLSTSSSVTVGGMNYRDEDILAYDTTRQQAFLVFDGSDVGLAAGDIDAFDILTDGSLLLSLRHALTLSGLGAVNDTDILRFTPTRLGNTTAGTFAFYLHGADVELTPVEEDIDAIDLLPDGRLLFSTLGRVSMLGVSGADEDLIALNSNHRTASLYFDGSQVGLTDSTEDLWGIWVDAAGKLYLSTNGTFTVPGVQGTAADIFTCQPPTTGGTITSCTYSRYWQGAPVGFGAAVIDGLALSGPLPRWSPTEADEAVSAGATEQPSQVEESALDNPEPDDSDTDDMDE